LRGAGNGCKKTRGGSVCWNPKKESYQGGGKERKCVLVHLNEIMGKKGRDTKIQKKGKVSIAISWRSSRGKRGLERKGDALRSTKIW